MADDRWQAVFESEHHRLFRSLLAHTGGPGLAADAEAEAFAQALRRGEAVRDPAAWVWRSALRIATGLLHDRRHQPDEIPSRRTPVAPDSQPDEVAALLDAMSRVRTGPGPGPTETSTPEPTDPSPTPPTTATTPAPTASTEEGPPTTAPATGTIRRFPVTAVTDAEYLVWGGEAGVSEDSVRADGFAVDLATGAVRPIPIAPLRPGTYAAGVWDGSELLVCCGTAVDGRVGTGGAAAWNPTTDARRVLAAPPSGVADQSTVAVWTGEEMVVAAESPTAAAYDPSTDE